jgi:hypothetical protein
MACLLSMYLEKQGWKQLLLWFALRTAGACQSRLLLAELVVAATTSSSIPPAYCAYFKPSVVIPLNNGILACGAGEENRLSDIQIGAECESDLYETRLDPLLLAQAAAYVTVYIEGYNLDDSSAFRPVPGCGTTRSVPSPPYLQPAQQALSTHASWKQRWRSARCVLIARQICSR